MEQAKLQNISEFMSMPLNNQNSSNKQSEYNEKYDEFKKRNKIKLGGYTILGDNHFIHIIIPSDSNPNRSYDVIIKLIPPNGAEKNSNMSQYYIQFFSNSPGFIYKYAVLYKEKGLLIEELYNKMDPEYMNTLPTKTNTSLDLSYDKSIYFACKFLSDNKFTYMSKFGPLLMRKKTPEDFFTSISSFKKMKVLQEFDALEKRINKSAAQERLGKKLKELTPKKSKPRINVKKSQSHTSGLEPSVVVNGKKVGTKNQKIKGKHKLPKR